MFFLNTALSWSLLADAIAVNAIIMSADEPLIPLPTGIVEEKAMSTPLQLPGEIARQPSSHAHGVVRPLADLWSQGLIEIELDLPELPGIFPQSDPRPVPAAAAKRKPLSIAHTSVRPPA